MVTLGLCMSSALDQRALSRRLLTPNGLASTNKTIILIGPVADPLG